MVTDLSGPGFRSRITSAGELQMRLEHVSTPDLVSELLVAIVRLDSFIVTLAN